MSAISSVSQYLPVTPPAPVQASRQAPTPISRDDDAKEAAKSAPAAKAPGTGTVVDIRA